MTCYPLKLLDFLSDILTALEYHQAFNFPILGNKSKLRINLGSSEVILFYGKQGKDRLIGGLNQ